MKKIEESNNVNNVIKSVQKFAKCTELKEWIKTKSEGIIYHVFRTFFFYKFAKCHNTALTLHNVS